MESSISQPLLGLSPSAVSGVQQNIQSQQSSQLSQQQPKRYRKMLFWNRLTSAVLLLCSLICLWGGIANFTLDMLEEGRIMIGISLLFGCIAMLYYTQKKWIWYSIMLIITLIISIGSFIGMLNLIDGPFEDINDNIKLLLLWAIVVLCIIGCIFAIKQGKRCARSLEALPDHKKSYQTPWKQSIKVAGIIVGGVIIYFFIGALCRKVPYIPPENFEKDWINPALSDEENGYVQLEKILTLENTDKIIRNLEICAGTLFNPSNTGEGCMLTGVEHVGNADFYNTLSKISKLPFQNNGIELLMGLQGLLRGINGRVIYYANKGDLDTAIKYHNLAYNLSKGYSSAYGGATAGLIDIVIRGINIRVANILISDYPLTVTQTKTLLKIYNDLIDKEVWMKRTYISEYHLLITLVEQGYSEYGIRGVLGSDIPKVFNGLFSYPPFYNKNQTKNMLRYLFSPAISGEIDGEGTSIGGFYNVRNLYNLMGRLTLGAIIPRLLGEKEIMHDNIRATALIQLTAALSIYKSTFGKRPATLDALVHQGILSSLPQDPHNLPFEYIILKKHGLASGGVLLMASTEIPSASNRVVKPGATTLQEGNISSTDDIADITLCDDITSGEGVCNYSDSSQLRYISIL